MTRQEKHKLAWKLRDQGLTYEQIGKHMGVCKSTARLYLIQPTAGQMGKPPAVKGKFCACGAKRETVHKGKPMCRKCLMGPDRKPTIEDIVNRNHLTPLAEAQNFSDSVALGHGQRSSLRKHLGKAIKKNHIKPLHPQEWVWGCEW
jgi:hypothetical protein